MRYLIRPRLVALGMTSRQLIAMLKKRGVVCSEQKFSDAVRGVIEGRKADLICETADQILTELESHKKPV